MPGNVRLKVMEITEDKDWERRKVMVKMDRPCSSIVLSHPPSLSASTSGVGAENRWGCLQNLYLKTASLMRPAIPAIPRAKSSRMALTTNPSYFTALSVRYLFLLLCLVLRWASPAGVIQGSKLVEETREQCRLTCHPVSDFRESNNRWFIPHVFKSSIIGKCLLV